MLKSWIIVWKASEVIFDVEGKEKRLNEIAKMMAHLVPLADFLILTRPQMDRAASLELLRSHAFSFGRPMVEAGKVSVAVKRALDEAGKEDLIVVTGSLFTVGEARAYLSGRGMIPA